MKKILLYILILIVVCLVPVQRQDVGDLEPIQAVWMGVDATRVVLKTDTGDAGYGSNPKEALEDMKNHSTGIVYLDTAQYLLVSSEAQTYISHLTPYLRRSVRICIWEGEGDVLDAAMYAKSRKLGCKLSQWQENTTLPKVPEKLLLQPVKNF